MHILDKGNSFTVECVMIRAFKDLNAVQEIRRTLSLALTDDNLKRQANGKNIIFTTVGSLVGSSEKKPKTCSIWKACFISTTNI